MKYTNDLSNREQLLIKYAIDFVLHEIKEKAMHQNSENEIKLCKAECIYAIQGGAIGTELWECEE